MKSGRAGGGGDGGGGGGEGEAVQQAVRPTLSLLCEQ